MPRMTLTEWTDGKFPEPENDNLDFCRHCWRMGFHMSHIPEGFPYEDVTFAEPCKPDYGETDYDCEHCHKPLTHLDDNE